MRSWEEKTEKQEGIIRIVRVLLPRSCLLAEMDFFGKRDDCLNQPIPHLCFPFGPDGQETIPSLLRFYRDTSN